MPRDPDRFRTWPGGGRLTRIEQRNWMDKTGKERAVEIALGPNPTGAAVMALREPLWFDDYTVTHLGQFGPPGVHLNHSCVSTCSRTPQVVTKRQGTKPNRFPEGFLPGTIGEVLQIDLVDGKTWCPPKDQLVAHLTERST